MPSGKRFEMMINVSIPLGGLWPPVILSITLAAVLLIASVTVLVRVPREDLPAVLDAIGRWLPWRRKDS